MGDGTGTGKQACQRAFASPTVQSARLEGNLPEDVVAEWGGTPPRDVGRVEVGQGAIRQAGDGTDGGRADAPGWTQGPLPTEVPLRRAVVREFAVDNEILLFDYGTECLYYLNDTACAIWRACDGKALDDLALWLTRQYGVDPPTALHHVRQVVEVLAVGGLISWETADAASA
jgi:hypothetical protein